MENLTTAYLAAEPWLRQLIRARVVEKIRERLAGDAASSEQVVASAEYCFELMLRGVDFQDIARELMTTIYNTPPHLLDAALAEWRTEQERLHPSSPSPHDGAAGTPPGVVVGPLTESKEN